MEDRSRESEDGRPKWEVGERNEKWIKNIENDGFYTETNGSMDLHFGLRSSDFRPTMHKR